MHPLELRGSSIPRLLSVEPVTHDEFAAEANGK